LSAAASRITPRETILKVAPFDGGCAVIFQFQRRGASGFGNYHSFIKKTKKTPRRELDTAMKKMNEVKNNDIA